MTSDLGDRLARLQAHDRALAELPFEIVCTATAMLRSAVLGAGTGASVFPSFASLAMDVYLSESGPI